MRGLVFMLLAAAPASALEPGTYAVICGQSYRAENAAAAVASCRHHYRDGRKKCTCARADVVTIAATAKPSFYLSGCWIAGPTRSAAIARCRKQAKEDGCRCDRGVQAVYGPFDRKPASTDLDDARVYRWLTDKGDWVDGDGQYPCFPAGTLVSTPAGARPIETIGAGDEVSSRDESGRPVTARVTRTKRRLAGELVVLTLDDGRSLRATANHPIGTSGGWVPAGELAPGDILITSDGERLVASIASGAGAEVYDLTVEPTHSYFAEGIWVHNY